VINLAQLFNITHINIHLRQMIHQQLLTVTLLRKKIKIFLLINQTKQNGSTLAAELALYGPKINQEKRYPTYNHYQWKICIQSCYV